MPLKMIKRGLRIRTTHSIGLGLRAKFVVTQNTLKESIIPSFILLASTDPNDPALTYSLSHCREARSTNMSIIIHVPNTKIEKEKIFYSLDKWFVNPILFKFINYKTRKRIQKSISRYSKG
jgi:hypothetical protein